MYGRLKLYIPDNECKCNLILKVSFICQHNIVPWN